jgi:glycosyl transferase family (putative galactosyltransferase)
VSKALCSIGAGPHEALLAVSEPTFRAYAERHGYEVITSTAADPGRPPAWAKVPMIRQALDEHDLVLWIDADAVIVDDREDIAAALAPDAQLALVQHPRDDGLVPNTGVTVWRSGEFARELLDRMWASTRFIHHPWWENAALLDVLGYDFPRFNRLDRVLRRRMRPPEPSPAVQFLPGEWNWTYLNRVPDPRIMHCLAVPVDQRLRDMKAALAGTLR